MILQYLMVLIYNITISVNDNERSTTPAITEKQGLDKDDGMLMMADGPAHCDVSAEINSISRIYSSL